MAYLSMTFQEILTKIQHDHVCMPSIQRKYVWDIERIEQLFDSILVGYPIGTFLIWNVSEEDYNNYTFYRINSNFNTEDGNWQEKRPIGWDAETWALLDGQQRLTSLCIGFRGSYTFGNKNSKKINEKRLYYNLTALDDLNKEDYKSFKFLNEENAKNDPNNLWIKVELFVSTLRDFSDTKHLDNIGNYVYIKNIIQENIIGKNENIKNILNNWESWGFRMIGMRIFSFARKIHDSEIRLFNYYLINNNTSLDTCTEIFVRINSGGQSLSKADLLFSTVVSKWESGRDVIDNLIKEVNKIGFSINSDFIMRTCLYVTNSKILFNVRNFTPDTVQNIINAFDPPNSLATAIVSTFKFLKDRLCLNKSNIRSINVLIPLIHHYYNCGNFDEKHIEEMQKYIYVSLLRKIFGSHGDTLLRDLRDGATDINHTYKFKNIPFNYEILISKITEERKKELYQIDLKWIDKILEYKKGYDSLLVLSLIYGNLPLEYIKYDQDHLHPKSHFSSKTVSQLNGYFNGMEDMVPNLGFLTPKDNRNEKKAKTLNDYYAILKTKKEKWYSEYKSFHFIDEDTDLDFSNFIDFFNKRKKILAEKLKNKFNLSETEISHIDNIKEGEEEDDYPEFSEDLDTDEINTELLELNNQENKIELVDQNQLTAIINTDNLDSNAIFINDANNLDKIKLRTLYSNLSEDNFNFLSGEFQTTEIYERVKNRYPSLCDDQYLCIYNCKNGNNSPEWHHRVRALLANLKAKNLINYNSESKKYIFNNL